MRAIAHDFMIHQQTGEPNETSFLFSLSLSRMTMPVLQRLLVLLLSILLLMSSFESMGLARILFLLTLLLSLPHFPLIYIVFNSQPVECDGHSIVSTMHWFLNQKFIKNANDFMLFKCRKIYTVACGHTSRFILIFFSKLIDFSIDNNHCMSKYKFKSRHIKNAKI